MSQGGIFYQWHTTRFSDRSNFDTLGTLFVNFVESGGNRTAIPFLKMLNMKQLICHVIRRLAAVVAISALVLACAEEPEAGTSCFDDDECAELNCHCVSGEGEIPGVCSMTCDSDDDCAGLGDDLHCSEDFCTGVNVCLRE